MTGRGGSVLVLLAVVVVMVLAAPPPSPPTSPPAAGPTLAERAAARGLRPPPPAPRVDPPVAEEALEAEALGARRYPLGVADPLPPARSRRPGPLRARPRPQTVGDDVYDPDMLPTNVVPTRYTVQVSPQIDQGVFYGATDIFLNVVAATSKIILHAADLLIDEVQILHFDRESGKFLPYGEASLTPSESLEGLERIEVGLTRELVRGEHYLLRFPLYSARLRSDLRGFYLSSYRDAKGNTRYLATTQFQPPAARYAFPCFDEPALKARFKVIVEHDRTMHARSNMPVVMRTAPTLTTIRTEFDNTVPMSTYLLAWVVSDFDSFENGDPTLVTWGRGSLLSPASVYLADHVAPLALRALEAFTGIPYALPKVDQFAIPDFKAGAMENWGLVTYREDFLLESDKTTIRIREFIATTVCHELGHQWTGNLVTLDWWSNTWLNEGFATYFESVICNQIFPEWKLLDKYVTDNTHVGMAHDVDPNQVAMSSPVLTAAAIEDKFDRISYKKGGAVLRMFEHIIGTDVFKKSMHRYLSAYAFSYGSPDRLFRSFDAEVSMAGSPLPPGMSFGDVARSWTEQAGVPVVTAVRDYTTASVALSHERLYLTQPDDDDQGRQSGLWFVPVPAEANPHTRDWAWSLADAPAPKRWLTPAAPSMTRDVDAAASEWMLLNPLQIGYYLVNYDEANWEMLRAELTGAAPPAIPAASRAQLLHDALFLARGGRLRYAVALPLLGALRREREAAPWKAGVEALAFLRDRLAATAAGHALKVFVKELTAEAFGELGFSPTASVAESYADTDKDEERFVRFYVSSHACYAGDALCLRAASESFASALSGATLHPDIKDAALCYAVQGSSEHFAQALDKWKAERDTAKKAVWAEALSCTLDHSLLQKLLDDILGKRLEASPSELGLLLKAVTSRMDNHNFIAEYYKENWRKIDHLVGGGFHFRLLLSLIGDIRTGEEYDDMSVFVRQAFPDEDSVENKEALARLQVVHKDLEWWRLHYKSVSEWLYAATGTGPQGSTTQRPTMRPTPHPPQGSGSSRATSSLAALAMAALCVLLL